MRGRAISLAGALVVCVAAGAHAQTPNETTRRAAAAFDEGVAHFKRAEYGPAAQSFLLADELVPSEQAIGNALAAARKANDYLSVAEAAERALARSEKGPLSTSAREALADAATRLSAIDASCLPAPCSLSVDGNKIASGRRYVLPGTHDVSAETPGGARALEHVSAVAGATYRVALRIDAPATAAPVASAQAQTSAPVPGVAAPGTEMEGVSKGDAARKPLPPAVVYAGAGATVLVAAIMAWSGFDALAEKDKYPGSDYNSDTVRSKRDRTDVLLGATLILGAATGLVAWKFVEWHPDRAAGQPAVSLSVRPTPFGGALVGTARF